ncbi:hypothetical protein MABM_52290 (plasmid) [Mycobacteroides abscessus]|nr:hypothetical protein MABM_51070 [Mycobacteroides abscessus]BBZ85313.1 hypothetical protein MABM_52290 [Mycobacteroides abscessus]
MQGIRRSQLGVTYRWATRPRITNEEAEAIDAGGRVCLEIRPDTLGYQSCWRIDQHDGPHLSRDGQAWYDIPARPPVTDTE